MAGTSSTNAAVTLDNTVLSGSANDQSVTATVVDIYSVNGHPSCGTISGTEADVTATFTVAAVQMTSGTIGVPPPSPDLWYFDGEQPGACTMGLAEVVPADTPGSITWSSTGNVTLSATPIFDYVEVVTSCGESGSEGDVTIGATADGVALVPVSLTVYSPDYYQATDPQDYDFNGGSSGWETDYQQHVYNQFYLSDSDDTSPPDGIPMNETFSDYGNDCLNDWTTGTPESTELEGGVFPDTYGEPSFAPLQFPSIQSGATTHPPNASHVWHELQYYYVGSSEFGYGALTTSIPSQGYSGLYFNISCGRKY
jgi:hypothetical protein